MIYILHQRLLRRSWKRLLFLKSWTCSFTVVMVSLLCCRIAPHQTKILRTHSSQAHRSIPLAIYTRNVASFSSNHMLSPDRSIMSTTNTNSPTVMIRGRGGASIPGREEMRAIFAMCRKNQWNSVLRCLQHNPIIPVTSMIMDNHISTTILHQAITSKGNTELRTRVIREILELAPQAATIKNGYGSLPLHVISQRNTKMDAPTKELLIGELVRAHQGALLQPGGVGKRTPLHIIFTGM